MTPEERSVLQRRAGCRIWAHLIFWNLIPFGWIISAVKTGSWIPVYIMLASMTISSITYRPEGNEEPETAFRKGLEHGQKIGALASLAGSVVTANLIMNARNQLKNSHPENDE
ncbi:MAG: hypothetical protein CV045_11915 [Cyanobacteria bacterium M5B4]|nr:hypothetical protein [Cyanobacteria bacterium KgW148]PLS67740.1 MAG: hypothetical protein CV045_11915 [Cyanobacteria bacterium M5B4]